MRDLATIVFVLSHACPLKCSFCCHTRDVVGPTRITRAMMVDWMQQFAGEAAVDRFCFTGGEPFLYLSDIKAAVATAREAGVKLPFHIVTAAQWVKDRDHAYEVLAELHSLGMDLIGLSYDHEHAKWVKPEQIIAVCEVAAELSMRVNLNGVFWNLEEGLGDLLPVDALPKNVRTRNYLAVPAGRAKRSSAWPRRYAVPNDHKFTCGNPGNYDLAIYPDGEVYPCCSGGMNIEAKLSCGNINRDSPADILRRAFANFHVRMVKEFGWGALYELVQREAPSLAAQLPRFEDLDSVCEICRDLNVNFADRLAPIYEIVEKEYARTRVEFEWRSVPDERPDGRKSFDGRLVSLDELVELLTEDRRLRLGYLVGSMQVGLSA